MAVLTPGNFTYAEWAARTDPTGKLSSLVNLLSQTNEILADMTAQECNSGNSFEFTQVVKLPTPSRRVYNQGVDATMAGVAKQITTCAEYGDWSKFDASLARLGGNLAALRFQEDAMHMEGLSQLVASDLFYANKATDPTSFTGFANIYNTVNSTTSKIASHVIDCGGTGSTNASMWLITWGPKQIHTIFPQGLPTGMQHQDMGYAWLTDSNSREYPGYRSWLQWNIGLAIHDWRYAVRAANIDVSLLFGGSAANLINILSQMVLKLPTMPSSAGPVQTNDDPFGASMGRCAIYVNRTVYLALDQQAQNKTNVLLAMTEWEGHRILSYRGIPIRIVDALLTTESRVV